MVSGVFCFGFSWVEVCTNATFASCDEDCSHLDPTLSMSEWIPFNLKDDQVAETLFCNYKSMLSPSKRLALNHHTVANIRRVAAWRTSFCVNLED